MLCILIKNEGFFDNVCVAKCVLTGDYPSNLVFADDEANED